VGCTAFTFALNRTASNIVNINVSIQRQHLRQHRRHFGGVGITIGIRRMGGTVAIRHHRRRHLRHRRHQHHHPKPSTNTTITTTIIIIATKASAKS
jgi:hypothetical protein